MWVDPVCPWCKKTTDVPGDGVFDGSEWNTSCCGKRVVAADEGEQMVIDRCHVPRPRPEQRIRWSKREGALLYEHHGSQAKATSGFLAYVFESIVLPDGKTLVQELEARGYDLTTLRFSIRKQDGR